MSKQALFHTYLAYCNSEFRSRWSVFLKFYGVALHEAYMKICPAQNSEAIWAAVSSLATGLQWRRCNFDKPTTSTKLTNVSWQAILNYHKHYNETITPRKQWNRSPNPLLLNAFGVSISALELSPPPNWKFWRRHWRTSLNPFRNAHPNYRGNLNVARGL